MSITSLPISVKPDTIVHREVEREKLNTAESFEAYRSYLFSIAYRMLGSVMDAEDMVQETYRVIRPRNTSRLSRSKPI